MSEHTKEPWKLVGYSIYNADTYIAFLEDIDAEDARRIVACVNACSGIGTDWLEKNAEMLQSMVGDIQNISCQLDEAKAQRDELLAMLKEEHWGRARCLLDDYGLTGKCPICSAIARIEGREVKA